MNSFLKFSLKKQAHLFHSPSHGHTFVSVLITHCLAGPGLGWSLVYYSMWKWLKSFVFCFWCAVVWMSVLMNSVSKQKHTNTHTQAHTLCITFLFTYPKEPQRNHAHTHKHAYTHRHFQKNTNNSPKFSSFIIILVCSVFSFCVFGWLAHTFSQRKLQQQKSKIIWSTETKHLQRNKNKTRVFFCRLQSLAFDANKAGK